MNLLRNTLSPYLLQHAAQPVHWREWDAATLAAAAAADKPLFISIGYAACHWCHVMARESFADAAIADFLNERFVNIKIDREERPDLDRIYQAAHYLLTRKGGGWPLSIFAAPDGRPFFGGTYFPPQARGGLPGFADLAARVDLAWRKQRPAIDAQNKAVVAALARMDEAASSAGEIDEATPAAARALFARLLDRENGGLGDAPKFPHPTEIGFLLAESTRVEADSADLRDEAARALRAMEAGGLHDHLGGGFFRYCVDARWTIPHFEKMLCDNGLLLGLFCDGHAACSDERFAAAARGIAEWGLREMRAPAGGFCASLDADSEGREGAFYAWDESAAQAAVADAAAWAAFRAHFGLAAGPGFEGRHHFCRRQSAAQTAAALGLSESAVNDLLRRARQSLLAARARRIRPARDDKILTAWNALFAAGLARAGRRFARPEWRRAAIETISFLRANLFVDGHIRAAWRDDKISAAGFLDDAAFLLDAVLEIAREEASADLLDFAVELGDLLIADFGDSENGGFFFTARGGEALIRRVKTVDDNAIPSGNGVAALALRRLGWLLGEPRFTRAAENTLRAFAAAAAEHPAGCATLLRAWRERLRPPAIVVLCGEAEIVDEWARTAEAPFRPDLLVFRAAADGRLLQLRSSPSPTAGARAYICEGEACRAPIDSRADFLAALDLG